jgi:hypothetical protein
MISKKIQEKLTPSIREIVPRQYWTDIPGFYNQVYMMDYYIGDEIRKVYVLGYWGDPNPVICFDVVTFEFLGVSTQEYALKHGVLL